MSLFCSNCEERRLRQLAIHKAWQEGKSYARSKHLDRFVLCLIEETSGYAYCEENDPRLGNELRELETIIFTN